MCHYTTHTHATTHTVNHFTHMPAHSYYTSSYAHTTLDILDTYIIHITLNHNATYITCSTPLHILQTIYILHIYKSNLYHTYHTHYSYKTHVYYIRTSYYTYFRYINTPHIYITSIPHVTHIPY